MTADADEFRQLRRRAEDALDALDRPGPLGNPARTYVGAIYDGGALPTAVPRVFLTRPVDLACNEAEGAVPAAPADPSASIPVLVLGPKVPAAGESLVARKVQGLWVSQVTGTSTGGCNTRFCVQFLEMDGTPIVGAPVANGGATGTTDSNGKFCIAVGHAGPVTFTATITRFGKTCPTAVTATTVDCTTTTVPVYHCHPIVTYHTTQPGAHITAFGVDAHTDGGGDYVVQECYLSVNPAFTPPDHFAQAFHSAAYWGGCITQAVPCAGTTITIPQYDRTLWNMVPNCGGPLCAIPPTVSGGAPVGTLVPKTIHCTFNGPAGIFGGDAGNALALVHDGGFDGANPDGSAATGTLRYLLCHATTNFALCWPDHGYACPDPVVLPGPTLAPTVPYLAALGEVLLGDDTSFGCQDVVGAKYTNFFNNTCAAEGPKGCTNSGGGPVHGANYCQAACGYFNDWFPKAVQGGSGATVIRTPLNYTFFVWKADPALTGAWTSGNCPFTVGSADQALTASATITD
jgi:hypothetical protein